jgi:hypothetical protein
MAAGIEEDEAKTDLCRAMADRKINVRVTIAATDYGMGGQVYSDGNVRVPRHLKPSDLDWAQSRPSGHWRIGPRLGEHYSWITGCDNRPIDLIELRTDDVAEVLRSAGSNNATSQRTRPNSNLGGGAKTIAIEQAIDQLWPNGIIPKGLSAKERDNQIISKVKENKGSLAADPRRAIQRALANRRKGPH